MTLKVGDRVRFIADNPNGGAGYGSKGQEAVVSGICDYVVLRYGPQVELEPFGALGFSPKAPVSCLELITEGPVRTVTRTVTETTITPGTYARITVTDEGKAGMVGIWLNSGHYFSPSDLRAAAAVLLELAGALE